MIFILSFYYVIDKNLFSLFKEKGNFVCARHPFDDRYLSGALGAHWADYQTAGRAGKVICRGRFEPLKPVCDQTRQIYDWWKKNFIESVTILWPGLPIRWMAFRSLVRSIGQLVGRCVSYFWRGSMLHFHAPVYTQIFSKDISYCLSYYLQILKSIRLSLNVVLS